MKLRKQRKRTQALFKKHRAYYWSVQHLASLIGKAYEKSVDEIRDSFLRKVVTHDKR